jgi:hypothetical protein
MIVPRRVGIFLMGVAAVVLALVVLIAHPSDEIDLLAGAGLAAGFGLVLLLAPSNGAH